MLTFIFLNTLAICCVALNFHFEREGIVNIKFEDIRTVKWLLLYDLQLHYSITSEAKSTDSLSGRCARK